MASKAAVLCFTNVQPTYNESIILTADVCYMEAANVYRVDVPATVAIADTLATMRTKIATAIRNHPEAANVSPLAANMVLIPDFSKA